MGTGLVVRYQRKGKVYDDCRKVRALGCEPESEAMQAGYKVLDEHRLERGYRSVFLYIKKC